MKVSCIIPAYNEEQTIGSVIRTVKKVRRIDEIIVVDDGSTDKTLDKVAKLEVKIIKHEKNRGKGVAIKTGVKNSTGDILLFLDADVKTLTARKINAMIRPLLKNEADFIKTTFKRRRGRVTELAVKPLLKVVFPFMKFKQPLSGQFALKRKLYRKLDISEERWGVDIQILIQAMKKKARIKEVSIGELTHKKQPDYDLKIMSRDVIETVLSELGLISKKHKFIFFDLDGTLTKRSTIEFFAKEWGFEDELKDLRKKLAKGEIRDRDITKTLAKHFRGKSQADVNEVCEKIKLRKNAKKVIRKLRSQRYRVRIVSSAFSPIVKYFAKKLNVYDYYSPELKRSKRRKFTGGLKKTKPFDPECCGLYICKRKAVLDIIKKKKVSKEECVAVGDGKNDECMFEACGLSIVIKPKTKTSNIRITNLAEVLVYVE